MPSDMEEGKLTESEQSSSDSGSVELPSHLNNETGDEHNSSLVNLGNCSSNDVIRSSLADLPQDAPLLPCVALSEIDVRRLSTLVSIIKSGRPDVINDCCVVFKGDFLRDFPAQTFLQEPALVECLINLCEENIALGKHPEVIISALECLRKMAEVLTKQTFKYLDPKFVVISEKVLDVSSSKYSWSILEFIWASITVSATCIRNSEQFSILNEAICLLKTCLVIHRCFFPTSCAAEVSRLSLLLADILDSKPPAFVFIQLLHAIKSFICQRPESLRNSQVLAESLQKSIVHAGVWLFNSTVSQFFITQLKNCRHDQNFSELLRIMTEMCQAITSANKLLDQKSREPTEEQISQAILSLDFIPDPKVAAACVEGLSQGEVTDSNALLSLLAHPVEQIQVAVYQKIMKIVEGSIGEEQAINPYAYSPDNIIFLCDTKVIQEIASYGLEHPHSRIKCFSEDILVSLIRCRLLVSPTLWSIVASSLSFLAPVLISKADGRKALQEIILNYYDLSNKSLSQLELIKGNSCLMFSKQEPVRAEATRRLLEVLQLDNRSYQMWPQTSLIQISNHSMASLCIVNEQLNLCNSAPGIYYNETSLRQIVALLGPGDSEPTIKYSALCQLSAMLQEPNLIQAFLQCDGVTICVKLLDEALVQKNTDVLSKCTVPLVSILLKSLSKQMSLIQELTQNDQFVTNLSRAMFLYSSFDADFKVQHSALLALVVFSDFVLKKTLSSGQELFVLPYSITDSMNIPFEASSFGKVSSYTPKNKWLKMKMIAKDFSSADNLSLIFKCHAAIEQYGTLPQVPTAKGDAGLLTKSEIDYLMQFDPKSTLTQALQSIQTASTHNQVLSVLPTIISYIQCLEPEQLKMLDWQTALSRFLMQPPGTQADSDLLNAVAQVLARYKVSHWISAKELCPKLDHRQMWCVQTFTPLLQSCLPHMSADDFTSTMRFLCNCLIHNHTAKSDGGIRMILQCFWELTTQQNVELSSRLLADLIVPLVDIVHTYNQDDSFVGLYLIDLSLSCLIAIQTNNIQNFFHHFYACSEHCDIMNILTHILNSDKVELKANCLSLLCGLAKANGFKKCILDFSRIANSAIILALDLMETCLVRTEAVTLISCLIDYNADEMSEEIFSYFSLLKHDWFGQTSWVHKGLYFAEAFHYSELNLISSPTPESSNGLIKQLVTPELMGKHYALLYNFISSSNCDMIMQEIYDHNLFSKALWVLSQCLDEKTDLNESICQLTNNCTRFVAICIISDEENKNEFGAVILEYPYLPAQLVCTLGHENFELIADSLLWLVIALLQGGNYTLFEDAFQQGQFWPALCVALQNPSSEHSAMLVIRAMTIEGKVNCSGLDDNKVLLNELIKSLMGHMVKDETHQHAMAALSGLLASSGAAKQSALKFGLLEGIVTALKHCMNGLLEVSDKKRISAISRGKIHPLIEELIDSFELLTSFVLKDDKIKRSVTQTILAEEINILWPICITNSKLLASALKFLLIFTENCESACSTLLLRKQLMTDTAVKHFSTNDSLLHQLISLMNAEIRVNKSLDTVHSVITILCQCCVSAECRAAIVKASVFAKVFCDNNGIEQLPPKTQAGILRLLENISRHPEGQLFVARITGAIDFFATSASNKCSNEIASTCAEIVRNLCFCPANRVLIVNSGVLIAAMRKMLECGDADRVHPVASALWSLAANNHRTKQALKAAGFPLALCKAKLACADRNHVLSTLDSAISTIER